APAVERDLAAVAALQRRLDEAGAGVRAAREAQRGAATATQKADERLRAAWRAFDAVRDAVAPLGPPPADRDDLVGAWAERDGQVAKALANHLRANNFERWLLEEALDSLVDGASRILRELSGGQYDLCHDKGEFSVVDHHDAGLRRAVRTLSGGETFQASLALALA